jgi:hypothetical protein
MTSGVVVLLLLGRATAFRRQRARRAPTPPVAKA